MSTTIRSIRSVFWPAVAVLCVLLVGYELGTLRRSTMGNDVERPTINPANVETVSWEPRVQIYRNFLSEEACEYILDKASAYVSDSHVTGRKGKNIKSQSRTSKGVFMTFLTYDPIILDVEARLAAWTQLPPENGETLYLLQYEEGQEYKPHYDYFASQALPKGKPNRIATVLVYLQMAEKGGQTEFPEVGLVVNATKGDAVMFWDYLPNLQKDSKSRHASLPVVNGTKYCMTKWIRMSKYRSWGPSSFGFVLDYIVHPVTLYVMIGMIIVLFSYLVGMGVYFYYITIKRRQAKLSRTV